jgi:hypothetical protein
MISLRSLLTKPFRPGSFTQKLISKKTISCDLLAGPNDFTYHIVKPDEEMRPDLISSEYYGTENFLDILCKFNGISNPFSLERDQLLKIPKNPSKYYVEGVDIIDKGTIQATPNLIPVSVRDQSRLSYLQRLGTSVAPPNVTLPNDKNIKVENGKIIFGADLTKVNKQDCPAPISRSTVLKNLIESKIFK